MIIIKHLQNRQCSSGLFSFQRNGKTRLKPIGYGETRLLNQCTNGIDCLEEQHQPIEEQKLKVICP